MSMEAITLDQIKSRHALLRHGMGIIYPTGTETIVALEAHTDRGALLEAVELYRSFIVKLENEIARLKEAQFRKITVTSDGEISTQSISDDDVFLISQH